MNPPKLHWIKTITFSQWIGFYWATTARGMRVWIRHHPARETWQIHTGDGVRWGDFPTAAAAMRAAEVGII